EGEDNFISRMYKGGLDIIPWPMFNDASWFKTLSKVNKKLDKQEAKYDNARAFLQNTKVIMAKLKICDWGSLDENLIQIRVATLKRLLPTVVAYGLEQKDSVIEQLTNHDTGELIDDPKVSLSDILHDFEKSIELLPDSDIKLYDEHESFERLSEDLRIYFEDIVQLRKESSNDREWFANFDKFFKYIIERRVIRVQNWYMQNTVKFPLDNSDVVNGKNEHQCRELCEDKGKCEVELKPKEQKETYEGLVNDTSFTFTKYIQLSKRLNCSKKIPPNEFKHTGKHTHNDNGFHYCNAKCPFCEYYCTLPYGHPQIHDTKHGNMAQTEFTGEDSEFEYAGHKLKVGDRGIFVLCNLFCKDLGRHRHIDYCKNEENCQSGNQGQGQDTQHINVKVQPNPEKPKDFISHKLFWERTGFK
ncbi:hypothetical protein RhiirA5_477274, partial [Rhizophagus irregularis]